MRLVADMVHRVATPPQLYPHSVLRQSVHGRGSLGRDVLAFLVHLRLLVLSKVDVPQQVLPIELPPHASADLIEAPGYSDLAAMAQDKVPHQCGPGQTGSCAECCLAPCTPAEGEDVTIVADYAVAPLADVNAAHHQEAIALSTPLP